VVSMKIILAALLTIMSVGVLVVASQSPRPVSTPPPKSHIPDNCRLDGPNSRMYCVFRNSGISGNGGSWGATFSLSGFPELPAGYHTIYTAVFSLQGPHPCGGNDDSPASNPTPPFTGKPYGAGSWAQCWREARDPGHVTWNYLIQGIEGHTNFIVEGKSIGWRKGPNSTVPETAFLYVAYDK
jgi:hypothetical protein